MHVWVGTELPPQLQPYASTPYTVARFIEDRLNGTASPAVPLGTFEPRPLQGPGADAIIAHADSVKGHGLFLLSDDVGTGKTGTAVIAANGIATSRRLDTILVVADRPAAITIPHWARTVAAVGDQGHTWVVTTYDRLARVSKDRWDIIIADEGHNLRHRTTKRWAAWIKLSGWAQTRRPHPYVIALTATPSQDPLGMGYLAPAFAASRGGTVKDWVSCYEQQLLTHGIHLSKGRYGLTWTDDPSERAADIGSITGWLTDTQPPAMLHRAAPWGSAPVDGLPVRLSAAEGRAYQQSWGQFCTDMDLARRGRDTARGRAAVLRFRQKAGMLRVVAAADWAIAAVASGYQVVISCEFVETAADPIREQLQDVGIYVACLYGTGRFDLESERLRFQGGEAPVAVMTATTSLSLHAKEELPDGRQASTATRLGLMHQARYSGLQGRQIGGRTHRDYQVSPWSIAYAEETVEEQLVTIMAKRYAATGQLAGDEEALTAHVNARCLPG